ncbi:MAG: protein YacL [Enterobacteriaceae bacterium]
MDYEFLRDITGVVKVRMSMGHEVVGHWFNEEVKDNLALLDEVEQAARTVKGSERSWQRAGHEYTLWLDGEEVMIRANQLEISGDEIEEGMSYYDEESSLCGVEDFLRSSTPIENCRQSTGSVIISRPDSYVHFFWP